MALRVTPPFTAAALAMALLLTGCQAPGGSPAPIRCASGEAMQQTTLYFGLSRPAGPAIDEAQWQRFVDSEVTPRFRDGLTVFAAQGQWLGHNGQVVREPSRALMLIHDADAAASAKIDALRTAYQQRFQQESVMRVDAPVCVAF
ncbi:DUF3574 domain-containing protein [Pantoea sp. 1.19]|uniref:DUF3574 domain-containing protein n=1 Tax=Pantoea sp. 1.19 TaxID=1925589 RepID=UPI000948E350|nr:DUF3574 domain-containing protein [Pantoea sp. 1.19]